MSAKGWRWLAVSVLIPLTVSSCAGSHPPGAGGGVAVSALTGIVTTPARIVLPRDAMLRLELADTSRKDAPPRTITLREIWLEGRQFPVAFELPYAPAAIDPGSSYALQVKITQGRRLLLENTAPVPVITNGVRSSFEVIVEPVPGP